MKETPLAYIPTDRLRALVQGTDLSQRAHGVALFADISGFTPLTEALARELGPQRGAEELTRHLNVVYDTLIGEVHRFGGSVIGFSGDAITCWFEHRPEQHAALPAAQAGIELQRAMLQFASIALPSGDTRKLALKVATAGGNAARFVVGDPNIQLIDVLAGSLLDRLAEAEHHCEKGEVVVDEVVAGSLGDAVEISEWRETETGERFGVVSRIDAPLAVDATPLPESGLPDDEARKWLLPAVWERLNAGQGEFLAELRPAVALFLRFGGLDYENDDTSDEKLNTFIVEVQRIIAQFDGSLIQLTFGDKGSYLYVAFGAPHAHEDEVVRACSAAVQLRELGRNLPFIEEVQIGVSRGRMRTGAYGAATRRTYGVQGDDVNLAARLMTTAQAGQILVSKHAQQTAGDSFNWNALPPVRLKGKSEPIPIFELHSQRTRKQTIAVAANQYAMPMVGRQAELDTLRARLNDALAGRGQIIGIMGEAGIGKSRLVYEALQLAAERNLPVHGGECESFGTNSSYLAWQSVWRSILALDPEWDTQDQINALERALNAADASLAGRLPLLGPVLGLAIPDNDMTRGFDAKFRKTSLEAMLADYLRAACRQAPLVIVLEDCHWLDPLSHDLLKIIGQVIINLPVLIVMAYRPPEIERLRAPGVEQMPHFTEIKLVSFTHEEAERMVRLKLQRFFGDSPVPVTIVQRITSRAEGNPFYIEELLSYLQDKGVDPHDSAALANLDLPTSLHSLILARVDQLGETEKNTLRVAAVVGRVFRAAVLWGAYPSLGEPWRIKSDLDILTNAELTQVEDAAELAYLFKHIVTQEVTYESLPFATRAMLHNAIGLHLESAQEPNVNLLAFHFDRSANTDKKRVYLLKAGEAAQAAYANATAIEYYTRVLPLLSPGEQIDVKRKLGQVLELVGDWARAREAYEQARALAIELHDPRAEARCAWQLGELFRKRGQYDLASQSLEEALATFAAQGDEAGAGQVLHTQGTIFAQRGDYANAETLYQKSLAIRRGLDDKINIANLLGNMGIVARYRGELANARALQEEGLAIKRELGDRRAIAVSLSNLGNVALDQQDYKHARAWLEEAVGIQRAVGDKAYIANALNNLANVLRAQGNYDPARECYRESLRLTRELGDRWSIAYLLEDIGLLAGQEGKPERTFVLVGAATALRELIGSPRSKAEESKLDAALALARRALGDEEWPAFLAEGKLLTMDDAIALALA